MDKFAKEIAQAHIRRPQERQYVQTTLGIGSIVCRGQVVTTRVQKSLNDEISHGDMMGLLGDILGLEGQTPWYPGLHIIKQGRWWDRRDNTLSPNG